MGERDGGEGFHDDFDDEDSDEDFDQDDADDGFGNECEDGSEYGSGEREGKKKTRIWGMVSKTNTKWSMKAWHRPRNCSPSAITATMVLRTERPPQPSPSTATRSGGISSVS